MNEPDRRMRSRTRSASSRGPVPFGANHSASAQVDTRIGASSSW